jgi:uncharacterized protein (DUF58 family)
VTGFDRVGGSRLTGFGTVVLVALLLGLARPPEATDQQIFVLAWAALLAVFVVGVVWPIVVVRRISVSASSPRDATVGDEVPVAVTLTGRAAGCEVRALDPSGAWHRVDQAGEGVLGHVADRRGVFGVLRLEVKVTAPFGIVAVHRVHEAELPAPVEIAPKPLSVDWKPAVAPVAGALAASSRAALGGDLVRSVRPYAPGDPAHLVHWPSTAKVGSLVVRELEPPAPVGQAVVVDLRGLGADAERAAAYAFGAALAVLQAGGELLLCTAEPDGPVAGVARTPIDAGRRLARAVEGEPGAVPAGWPVVEIGR